VVESYGGSGSAKWSGVRRVE